MTKILPQSTDTLNPYHALQHRVVSIDNNSPESSIDIDEEGNVIVGILLHDGIYAEIYNHDTSASQSIPTGTTYTKLTNYTNNGLSNNCTSDATNDKITITKTGKYRISGSFNFNDDTNNVVWRIATFLNGVEQNSIHVKRKISTAGDSGSASFTGFIDVVTVPIDLDVRVRHDYGGSVGLVMEYSNLNVQYIGE